MATDEIKARQKIQRFNLTNGGAVEVNGSECGNVFIEAFDEDSADHGMVLEPTPPECDALIAAIGRALGRAAPASTPLSPEDKRAAVYRIQRAVPKGYAYSYTDLITDLGDAIGAELDRVAAREQGATVPRAGVAAFLPLLAGISNMLDASDDAEAKREAVRRIDRIVVAIGRMTTGQEREDT